jgi:hypothetical protein
MQTRAIFALACAALCIAAPAAAQLPMVGGTYGQTVRLVITAGDPIPTEKGCTADVRLLTRALLPAVAERVALRPGESSWVEVNLSTVPGSLRRRVELLPAVSVVDGTCIAATEVYENISGRTMAHTPGLLLPAQPGLLLPAMPVLTPTGASTSQIIRLGVIRGFDPQPEPPACTVQLGFADASGAPVGPSRAVDLQPGESSVLDLDPSLLLPASGEPLRARRFVRPRLLLPASGGGDATGCLASVQVYDRLTGWTMAAYGTQ